MKVLLIGLDAFDPKRFERLYEEGHVPNLGKFVEAGQYARFTVSNPPQSEVSWTSIATGLNPGEHGMFDFVHRDPATYALNVSLLPTRRGLGGTQFVAPFTARTIFDQSVSMGYPATALWWPAMFPARRQSPVRTLPGLGTPDILGRLGVGTLLTADHDLAQENNRKTASALLTSLSNGQYVGKLPGPLRKKRGGTQASEIEVRVEEIDDTTARIMIGKIRIELPIGEWSPIIEVSFKLGRFASVRALTRLIVTQIRPYIRMYALPLQLHPLHSPWPYATPRSFVKETWNACGPFLSLGWPQDTTALEEDCIADEQFLSLCDSIIKTREQILLHHIDSLNEGVLACVFDTLDRVQHMFWAQRPDLIDKWYIKLDGLVGRIKQRLRENGVGQETRIVVVSDHGFADFYSKAHVNRWLLDNNYLASNVNSDEGNFGDIDWSRSKAYAVGLNSIYINESGREGQGSVSISEKDAVVRSLVDDLSRWQGPDGRPVVQRAWRRDEVFEGPLTGYGPDIVVGFSQGYRASAETGLGQWTQDSIEPNHDHWRADHCINPEAVPGVIFHSQGLGNFPRPSFRDIPAMTIGAMPDAGSSAPPPSSGIDKDEQAVIEERLRSLGYL